MSIVTNYTDGHHCSIKVDFFVVGINAGPAVDNSAHLKQGLKQRQEDDDFLAFNVSLPKVMFSFIFGFLLELLTLENMLEMYSLNGQIQSRRCSAFALTYHKWRKLSWNVHVFS